MKKTSEAIKHIMEKHALGKLAAAVILTLVLTGCASNEEEIKTTTETETKSAVQETVEFPIVGETTVGQYGNRLAVMVNKDGIVELFNIRGAKIQDDVKALTGSCLQGKMDSGGMTEMLIKLCTEEGK